MKCLNCGKESKTKYCNGACRAAYYRKRTQTGAQNEVHAHELSAQTEAHAQSAQITDNVSSLTIDDIIKMPLDKAKAILRGWANGNGNAIQCMLGNIALEYDVIKYNYPVSHLINTKTALNQI